MEEYTIRIMLIDDVTITVKAGNGGNGAATFRQNEGNPRGGPDGGNGGNGGDLFVQGIDDIMGLQIFRYKKVWKAEDGVSGKRKNLYGRNGQSLTIRIPVGTCISEENGNTHEILDTKKQILLAKGGKGGRGNNEFKSATNQTPTEFEYGEPGVEKKLHLELRLIADIGLIGLPNAGKSSLLSLLTHAHPKIANYPFTTLEPNLGMMGGIIIADIPGLIEGASHGRGLGIKFLKHIEKTKLLVHCIDVENIDPIKTYEVVRKEFAEYNKLLLEKSEIILLTKTDLAEPEEIEKKLNLLKKLKKEVLAVSVYDDSSIGKLEKMLEKAAK